MVADNSRLRPQPHRRSKQTQRGDAAEKIELLRLRGSDDPTARAIALFGSQILRKLDAIAEGLEVRA